MCVPLPLGDHCAVLGGAVEGERAQVRPRTQLTRPVANGRERRDDEKRAGDAVLPTEPRDGGDDLRRLAEALHGSERVGRAREVEEESEEESEERRGARAGKRARGRAQMKTRANCCGGREDGVIIREAKKSAVRLTISSASMTFRFLLQLSSIQLTPSS